MVLEVWELDQRAKGNIAGADEAQVLHLKYGDVNLPSTTIKTVQTFSDEARLSLSKKGYVFRLLTGQSINDLKAADRRIGRDHWGRVLPYIEDLRSRVSEVAIIPDRENFFLPRSNNKSLAEQESMVAQYGQELKRKMKIPDVEVIIGEAPDYAELVFAHLDKTGFELFGEKHNYHPDSYRYTRTRTCVPPIVIQVGNFNHRDGGLSIYRWGGDEGFDNCWVAPLIVPASLPK